MRTDSSRYFPGPQGKPPSCLGPPLGIDTDAAAREVAQHRVRQKPFAVLLRQAIAKLDEGPGAEHVDVRQRPSGPRCKAPAEQCPDIGISWVGHDILIEAARRLERLDREIAGLELV